MRLQWKYALIINLMVIAVLVAFYFFDSIRMRREMSTLHALSSEQGATLKVIVENSIQKEVVSELTTRQAFNIDRINQLISNLKQIHPDMKNVVDVQITYGDTRVRSSLLSMKTPNNIHLTDSEKNDIITKGAKIETLEGEDSTTLTIDYSIPPKRLIAPELQTQDTSTVEDLPIDFWRMLMSKGIDIPPNTSVTIEDIPPENRYQTGLNKGKFPFELWRMFIANKIYLSPDATVSIDQDNNKWRIKDSVNGHNYVLWQEGENFWIHMADANNGYIQVLFDVPFIQKTIHSSLLMHAILIVIVGVLLVILIDLTTNKLIMKPLSRMTDIIQNAETSNLSTYLQQSYGTDDISKATRNLLRMFIQLKSSHSRKIAALGQFAAGVAHEIRNPLNSIGMTAQHLKSIFSQPDITQDDIQEAIELLDIVDEKIVDLKQTSEQFLALNRPRKLDLVPLNLNDLIEFVLSEFILIADEANIHIIKNYDEKLPVLQLDEMLMRQTIFNFVQNSIQALPKGGSIYLTTSVEKTNTLTHVVLEIRDTGIGIPEENQERIYDAYFTTKEDEGGIGLGLSVSHQIITAHQGRVEVRSKIGMGTAFKISFPTKNVV